MKNEEGELFCKSPGFPDYLVTLQQQYVTCENRDVACFSINWTFLSSTSSRQEKAVRSMEMILFFPFCRSTFNWRQEIPSETSCETQEGPSWLWASFPRKKACPCRVRLRDGHPPRGQPARRSAWSCHKQHVFHSEPRTVHLLPTQKRWRGDQIASACLTQQMDMASPSSRRWQSPSKVLPACLPHVAAQDAPGELYK